VGGGRLVHDEDKVGGQRLGITGQAVQQAGRGLGWKSRPAGQVLGRLALPVGTQHRVPGAGVGVGQRAKGGGLAPPGVGLQQAHPSVAAGQVAHGGLLIGAQARMGAKGLRHRLGGEREPDVALQGQGQEALLGAQEIRGGVGRPSPALGEGRLDQCGLAGQEAVGHVLQALERRALGVRLGVGP